MLAPCLKTGMVRINDYEDLNKVLIDLKPSECVLLLIERGEDLMSHVDSVEIIQLRGMGDKTKINYALALAREFHSASKYKAITY
jgi:hypothetical protein